MPPSTARRVTGVPSNAEIAELLARVGERAEGHRQRAYRRAARAALAWPEEAAEVLAAGRPLTELTGIGPRLAGRIESWIEDPPEIPEPPETRRAFSTYAAARALLAENPAARRDLRADLQMHTLYSDGTASVLEMARASMALGHSHVAITDHSAGLRVVQGLDETGVKEQAAEIEEVNAEVASDGFLVMHALETNLGVDGSGDVDPDTLGELDLVLGSFHTQLRVTEDQTERYLAAVRNPSVHVLGHPRGRKFNTRSGLRADWGRVFSEAQAQGKAVEVDCYPDRQDIDVDLLEVARDTGVMVSIGTDAHAIWELDFIDLGVAAVVAAGIPRNQILNYMSADALLEWAR
jgi:putative hydrolase